MKISGIYKIINRKNGKYYVGSSFDIFGRPHGRFCQHRYHLNSQRHYNRHLQSAWNKYGHDSFDFKVVEEFIGPLRGLLELEQKYLDTAATEKKKCYNQTFYAITTPWTEARKKRRSVLISGKNNPNYGNGDKIRGKRNPFYGKTHSREAISKIKVGSMKRLGKNNSAYDHTIYTFYNNVTDETIASTRGGLMIKHPELKSLGVCILVKRQCMKYKNWIIRSRE